jgi:hypothetical protein
VRLALPTWIVRQVVLPHALSARRRLTVNAGPPASLAGESDAVVTDLPELSGAQVPEPRRTVPQPQEPRRDARIGIAHTLTAAPVGRPADLATQQQLCYPWRADGRGKIPANGHNALVAQRIEHRFPKPGVAGSSPAGGAKNPCILALSYGRRLSPGPVLLPNRQNCRHSAAATRRHGGIRASTHRHDHSARQRRSRARLIRPRSSGALEWPSPNSS